MYLTVLWTEESKGHIKSFDIKEHKELQEAVLYLVKNGAKFDNQEIVQKVDWMPKGNLSSSENKPQNEPSRDPKEVDPGPPPGTMNGPAEQPVTINAGANVNNGQKKSMFDSIIPPHMRKGL